MHQYLVQIVTRIHIMTGILELNQYLVTMGPVSLECISLVHNMTSIIQECLVEGFNMSIDHRVVGECPGFLDAGNLAK